MLDVIVVGAGMAGVRTAQLLQQAGLRVQVLEARERCGGRLHSVQVAGVTIDAGGQWVGPGQDRVLALIRELGLTLVPTWHRGQHLFVSNGKAHRRRLMLPPVGPAGLLRLLRVTYALDRGASRVDVHAPWNTPDAATLDRQSVLQWLLAQGVQGEALNFLDGYLSAQYCRSISEISVLEGHQQLATIGGWQKVEGAEKWFVAEGAQTVVERLAQRLGDALCTGQQVERITQTDHGVEVSTANRTWHARWVVVATPPAVTAAIGFTPALPPVVAGDETFSRPGDVIKVVSVYERPWWRSRGLSGMSIAPSEPFSITVDGSPADGAAGILVGFAAGPGAARARASDVPLSDQLAAHARRWLGDGDAPEPVAVQATDWTAEPFSRGGYAARRAPGQWTAHPVPNGARAGRCFFAGSETATAWRSYMEGALQSAERAAAEVLGAARG